MGVEEGLEEEEEEEEAGSGDERDLRREMGAGVEREVRRRGEGGGPGAGATGQRSIRGAVLGAASVGVGVLGLSPRLTGEKGSTVTLGDEMREKALTCSSSNNMLALS